MLRRTRGLSASQIVCHEVGGTLSNHQRGGCRMAGGQLWNNGIIDHPQVVHAVNPETWIDDGKPV